MDPEIRILEVVLLLACVERVFVQIDASSADLRPCNVLFAYGTHCTPFLEGSRYVFVGIRVRVRIIQKSLISEKVLYLQSG